MSTVYKSIPDRDGPLREAAGQAIAIAQNLWNKVFDEFTNQLCKLIAQNLKSLIGKEYC